MAKKQFKAESKRLLDLMINSIYTNREIFLREIISNASDALDKLAYRALTDEKVGLSREDFAITVTRDAEAGILTVSDNGIGMSKEELEENLILADVGMPIAVETVEKLRKRAYKENLMGAEKIKQAKGGRRNSSNSINSIPTWGGRRIRKNSNPI